MSNRRAALLLLDIDQENDWWINYPAYQAKLKGAKAVLAMREFEEPGDDRIGVQDVCGPADAPALAISHEDAQALRKAINENGGDSVSVATVFALFRHDVGIVPYEFWYCGRVETSPYGVCVI